MKYKVGDKIRVREDCQDIDDIYEMKKLKGKVVTISKCQREDNYNDGEYYYKIKEDNGMYDWTKEYFEPIIKSINESIDQSDENVDEVSTNSVESVVENGQNTKKSTVKNGQFTKEDFKFGDIVTFRGGEKRVVAGNIIINEGGYFNKTEDFDENLLNYANTVYDIMKVQRYIHYSQYGDTIYTLTTLYERKEEILDEKEKEYLSAVIKPFRNDIEYIVKTKTEFGYYISIAVNDETIDFPYFDENTMYKEMKLNYYYTLKELGL